MKSKNPISQASVDNLYFYSPISFRQIFNKATIKKRETYVLICIWFLASLLSITLGAFVVIENLSGLNISIGPIEFHYTFYPSMIICTLLFFWLGFWWAFIPAYLSSFVVALLSGLPMHWSVLFGFADLIPFAIFSMVYRNFKIPYNLSNFKSVVLFIFVVLLGTLSSSVSSFVWSLSQNLSIDKIIAIWQGWWVGGTIRIGFVVSLFLFFFSKPVENLKRRHFPITFFSKAAFKSVISFIILTGIVITSFVLITIILSNLVIISKLNEILVELDTIGLLKVLNPIQIALISGLLITVFVASGGIFLAKSWSKHLEAEVLLRTNELKRSEEKYRILFESMTQGVTYQNAKGEIIDANPAAEEILGLNFAQMNGRESIDPRWKSIHEDGTEFPGDEHPSIKALKSGKGIYNTIMGVFNPKENDYRWIKIDAIPQFKEGDSRPFQVFSTFDDITEKRRADFRLQENLDRYIKAQQIGKVGNWEYYIQEDIFWASDEAKRIFGFSPDENDFTSEYVENCIPEREQVHQALVDLIENGSEYNLEYQVLPKNGEPVRYANSIAELSYDNKGKPHKVVGVILDITERKMSEQELKNSEEKFRNIFENSVVGKSMTLMDGTLIVNKAFSNILGYSEEELTKISWQSITHPDDIAFSEQKINEIVSGKTESARWEKRYIHKNGQVVWVDINTTLQKDVNGNPDYFITAIYDITERKQADVALKESEEKFFKIFQSSPNSIILTRLSDYEIVNANEATVNITGYSLSDLIGKKQSELDVWKSIEERKLFGQQLVKNGVVKDFESEFVKKSGEDRIWKTSGEIVQINNEKYVLGIIEDITELRLKEYELKRQSEFISTMTENQPAGVVACDEEGQLVLFNRAAKEWHGIDIMEIPQDEWAANYNLYKNDGITLLDEDEIPLVQAFKEKTVKNYEFIIKAHNKDPRVVSCNGASFYDAKGNKLGAVIIMNDVTQQKKSEEKLKRSEYLLNEAGRISKVGGFDLDLETMDPYFSDQIYQIYELPKGKPPKVEEGIKFYAPEARPLVEKALKEAIENFEPYDLEVPFITAKGKRIWVRTMGRVEVKNGEAVRLYGAMQDVTESKEVTQKLLESQQRYQTLFENQPSIIWEEDFSLIKKGFDDLKRNGIKDFRNYFNEKPEEVINFAQMVKIIEVNEAGLEILEAETKEELITKLPFYFDSKEAWEVFKEELIVLAEGKLEFISEIPVRTIKGNKRQLYLKLVVQPEYKENFKRVLVTFQDISILKEAELKLMESEQKYRELVENSHDLIWAVDAAGKITFLNRASKLIYGYDPEELIGKSFFDFVPKEQIEKDTKIFAESMGKGEEVVNYESQFTHKDGHKVFLLANARILRDESGNIIGTAGSSKDITEQKLKEDELKKSEQRFRSIVEGAPDPIFIQINKCFVYLNKHAVELFGAKDETELLGKPVLDRFHPDFHKKAMERINKLNINKKLVHEPFEQILIQLNGNEKWVETKGEPIIYKGENGGLVFVRDVTSRKLAEKELSESKLLLENINNNLPGVVVRYKVWSDGSDNFVFISKNTASIWGVDSEKALKNNKLIWDLIDERDFELVKKSIAESLDSLKPWNIEFRIKIKKDASKWFHGIGLPNKSLDGSVIWNALILNITDRKNAEIELRKIQGQLRALYSNLDSLREEERKMLARELHDELGQVLTSIKINTSLIKNSITNNNYNKQYLEKEINEIQNIIDEANRTMKRLVHFLRPEYLDNLGLIIALKHLFEQIENKNELLINFQYSSEKINLDSKVENIIFRVIQEALTNTIKHSKANSVDIKIIEDLDKLKVIIKDDGVGFVEEGLNKTTSFGLLGMRERLKSINTQMNIDSKINSGTTISFLVNISK